MTNTNTKRIPNGTTVTLPDGTTARVSYDPRDGTYVSAQELTRGTESYTRYDWGWRREFLTVA